VEWLKLLPLHPQRKRGSEKEEEKARWVTENQLLEKKSEKGKKKKKSEKRFGEMKETLTFAPRSKRREAKRETEKREWGKKARMREQDMKQIITNGEVGKR
jgi:hypothetical protein